MSARYFRNAPFVAGAVRGRGKKIEGAVSSVGNRGADEDVSVGFSQSISELAGLLKHNQRGSFELGQLELLRLLLG